MPTISMKEYKHILRAAYLEGKTRAFPLLQESYDAGDWEEFQSVVMINYEVMPEAFAFYYDDMPEQFRRDFVVSCYDHHGDSLPACRKALRALPKNGINELPKAYRNKEFITVYRAGEEDPDKAKYRISWTLDKKVALFFMQDYFGSRYRTQYLYRAKIRPCDVIAYNNDRKEKEVLQYRKVFDVEIIGDKTTHPANTKMFRDD